MSRTPLFSVVAPAGGWSPGARHGSAGFCDEAENWTEWSRRPKWRA
ncbi:hypothetical protein ACFFRL_09820 [Agromyces hippuratus]